MSSVRRIVRLMLAARAEAEQANVDGDGRMGYSAGGNLCESSSEEGGCNGRVHSGDVAKSER
jgi:hypothetical protein